jgi:8-oxo-dGTP pyrophosphatase MutT (NUDIX family)
MEKDFGSGVWECVTGRLDQGEGFEDAARREVVEEIGMEVELDGFLGTTHFYRGEATPQNELVGVVFTGTIGDLGDVRLSGEHSEYRWVAQAELRSLVGDELASSRWLIRVVQRAEAIRGLNQGALRHYFRQHGFELG